jgi:hypothetical protein
MTEWYGIGKTEDPEAGVCVWYPVEGEQQMASWGLLGALLYCTSDASPGSENAGQQSIDVRGRRDCMCAAVWSLAAARRNWFLAAL